MNNKVEKKIVIIGAGVSGLVAAIELESQGYAPIIVEQTNTVGGRVASDEWNGIFLDHGFQVLLSAYPAVEKYLDIQALDTIKFLPGAIIYKGGKQYNFGDPLRHLSFLIPTIISPLGTLLDKWKIFKLSQFVKNQTVQQIFETQEIYTLQFLKNYGFSNKIITQFFKPFYTGIFLEPDLHTSSRMFLFVFKMFAQGSALLPNLGIQAVSLQLAARLRATKFMFNTTVANILGNTIVLADNTTIVADAIVVASGANQILKKNETVIGWQSCTNLYFTCIENTITKPIIGLIADDEAVINNIYFIENAKPIVSVTVVKKHNYTKAQLIEIVKKQLLQYCNIQAVDCIKQFEISNALPKVATTKYLSKIADITINEFTFLAGDYVANGSLNAAMLGGELASKCVIDFCESR